MKSGLAGKTCTSAHVAEVHSKVENTGPNRMVSIRCRSEKFAERRPS